MEVRERRRRAGNRVIVRYVYRCMNCGHMERETHEEERKTGVVNKPKAQGTAFETFLVKHFTKHGLESERIAEGGMADLGDVRVEGLLTCFRKMGWVLEAKATQVLNVTRELDKARKKAGTHPVALVWKRLVKTETERRGADGVGVVVVIDLETFTALIGGSQAQGDST